MTNTMADGYHPSEKSVHVPHTWMATTAVHAAMVTIVTQRASVWISILIRIRKDMSGEKPPNKSN
jgi:hypothetical protein